MHCNDNLQGFRRPAAQRQNPKPVLACHWYSVGSQLECRWQAEANDEMPSDVDQDRRPARRRRWTTHRPVPVARLSQDDAIQGKLTVSFPTVANHLQ
jgi:hypothetical protein